MAGAVDGWPLAGYGGITECRCCSMPLFGMGTTGGIGVNDDSAGCIAASEGEG